MIIHEKNTKFSTMQGKDVESMPTPLYDRLRELSHYPLTRLDMPGHHGRPTPGMEFWPAWMDVTEHPATGDLFDPEEQDPIEDAQQLWARSVGMDSCLFLTGGSTQGIHAGLALTAGSGGSILVDRASHRAVYHGMALLDLHPHYLSRPWLEQEGVTGAIDPSQVDEILSTHREIKTVCVTSPTYYGVLSDIPAISQVCHRYGAKLMVDGAHGAHLPFLGYTGFQAADVVVVSAHKTLPAPGQTALLLAQGYSQDDLRHVASIYGSSSPNYVLMAGLDVVREYMEEEGRTAYTEVAGNVEQLRRCFPSLSPNAVDLDPTRFVVCCPRAKEMAENWMKQQGLYYEMADMGHIVMIFSCADRPEVFHRVREMLRGIPQGSAEMLPPPPPFPQQVMSLRQALFSPVEEVDWADSVGRVCACQLAPYPPGVPVVAPGEKIDKKHLAYLEQIGYTMGRIKVVIGHRSL